MSEKIMISDSELYNNIVEMLSNGSFLQLNGKAINLTELNEYINAQQEEIERLNTIIKEVRELLKNDYFEDGSFTNQEKVFELLEKENENGNSKQ